MKAETVTFLLDELYEALHIQRLIRGRSLLGQSIETELTIKQVLKKSGWLWRVDIKNFYGWELDYNLLSLVQALTDLNLPNRTTIHLLGTMKTELTYSVSHRFNLTTYRLKVSPLNTYETLIQLKEHFE